VRARYAPYQSRIIPSGRESPPRRPADGKYTYCVPTDVVICLGQLALCVRLERRRHGKRATASSEVRVFETCSMLSMLSECAWQILVENPPGTGTSKPESQDSIVLQRCSYKWRDPLMTIFTAEELTPASQRDSGISRTHIRPRRFIFNCVNARPLQGFPDKGRPSISRPRAPIVPPLARCNAPGRIYRVVGDPCALPELYSIRPTGVARR